MTMVAALLLPFALMQADAASVNADRYARCVERIEQDPAAAYEDGMAWAADTQSISAYRCAALALIGQDRPDEGARRLESLANVTNPTDTALRAELFSQAGNAWLLAREPGQARSAFTRAISTM